MRINLKIFFRWKNKNDLYPNVGILLIEISGHFHEFSYCKENLNICRTSYSAQYKSICRLRLIFESNKSIVRALLFSLACIGRVACVARASKYTERVFQANIRSMGNLKSHTQPRIGTSLTCPGLASSMAVRISPIDFCTRGPMAFT